jgi:drug/metabolite transporter (DMT)-like permease
MKELKPTTVAVFIYLQPVFATVFAIGLGKDELNMVKIVSAVLIFSGVYLVTAPNNAFKTKSKEESNQKRTTPFFLSLNTFRKKYDTINDWFW